MTDRALLNAKKHREGLVAARDELIKQIDEVKRQIATTDQFISDWYAFAGTSDSERNTEGVTESTDHHYVGSDYSGRIKNPDRGEVRSAAVEIIDSLGAPISLAELFQRLSDRGIVIRGKDPEAVLNTMMWRMKDTFVRLPKFGIWLRDRPHPESGYVERAAVDGDGMGARILAQAKLLAGT